MTEGLSVCGIHHKCQSFYHEISADADGSGKSCCTTRFPGPGFVCLFDSGPLSNQVWSADSSFVPDNPVARSQIHGPFLINLVCSMEQDSSVKLNCH